MHAGGGENLPDYSAISLTTGEYQGYQRTKPCLSCQVTEYRAAYFTRMYRWVCGVPRAM